MRTVTDIFEDLVLSRTVKSRGSRGYINIDCPSCGDTRGRGGFTRTTTGGWRYKCFNGGCEFSRAATGWEPDHGVGGRPRRLFQMLGGDIRKLPVEALLKPMGTPTVGEDEEPEVARDFPEMSLPEGTVPFSMIDEDSDLIEDEDFMDVVQYARGRGDEIFERVDFMWNPNRPRYLIIPFRYYGKIVGWAGRCIDDSGSRYIGYAPPDFTYGQDQIEFRSGRAVIAVEGVLDAAALGGSAVAFRSSSPTAKQVNLLNLSGRDVIVLPDWEREGGGSLVEVAKENDWFVSHPKWAHDVKDASESVRRYGTLYTVETVVRSAHKNYVRGDIRARLGSILN